jgi:adenylate cyclase
MDENTEQWSRSDAGWHEHLTGELPEGYKMPKMEALTEKLMLGIFRLLPGSPRCLECTLPMAGLGHQVVRPLGLRAASFSPRICNMCENAVRKHEGGAEVDVSLLFADVRGSTSLAESMGTSEYQRLIRRFYEVASAVIIEHNGLVNRLMGDQVIGIFAPRFAGANYAGVAIKAGSSLLIATGHQEARLSSAAAAGELVVSEEAAVKAGLDQEALPLNEMTLKGIAQPIKAGVISFPD